MYVHLHSENMNMVMGVYQFQKKGGGVFMLFKIIHIFKQVYQITHYYTFYLFFCCTSSN